MSFAVEPGHMLTVEGDWQPNPGSYGGTQFRAKTARLYLPADPAELLAYAVRRTPGMGPAAQMRIWSLAGEHWREVDIKQVPGLTSATRGYWAQTLAEIERDSVQSETLAYLTERGCTERQAALAWREWDRDARSVVTADPYRLTDLPGVGYRHVDDHVRAHYSIADDDPRRLRACLVYLTEQALDATGETVADASSIRVTALGLLSVSPDLIDQTLADLVRCRRLIEDTYAGQPVLCLAGDHAAEAAIAEYVDKEDA
jgi:exodeoxyribonuclease V alpha subunit